MIIKAAEARIHTVEILVEEYSRLKDIETRFTIIREEMLHAEYCPLHTQIILGIEKEFKETKYEFDSMRGLIKKQEGK